MGVKASPSREAPTLPKAKMNLTSIARKASQRMPPREASAREDVVKVGAVVARVAEGAVLMAAADAVVTATAAAVVVEGAKIFVKRTKRRRESPLIVFCG